MIFLPSIKKVEELATVHKGNRIASNLNYYY